MKQLTKEEAIEFSKNESWKQMSEETRALFQLHQDKLCMPFAIYHQSVESLLNRSVWTHEFAKPERLVAEWIGDKPKATMEEIIDLIPKEKLLLIYPSD